MMGVMRRADLLLGEDSERPLISRLTFILSFFMLTTGYVFYFSFYGCPFELKSLKLEHKIEEEVKEKTFYENLLTIIYGEGQTENIVEEEKKWSEHVLAWWNVFSRAGTKPRDMDDSKPLEESPFNNSIKVLFKSILLRDRETDKLEIMEVKTNQTNGSLKESEPENSWSLFSFNFASAASLPLNDKTEEEKMNFFDSLENNQIIEEEERQEDKETDKLDIMQIMPNQTNGSLKEPESKEHPWSLFSFNFASAASLPLDDKTEEEKLNFFDSLEDDKITEEDKSSEVVLGNIQCDGKVTENIQPQIITAAE